MARGLKPCMRYMQAALLAVGVAALLPSAAAQALRDPTRPPAMLGKFGAGAAGVPRSAAPEWILQSVLISPERRYAIINGQVVSLGESVAGAELVGIREGDVTLRAGGALRTVQLFPDIEMRGGAKPRPGASDKVRPDSAQDGPQERTK